MSAAPSVTSITFDQTSYNPGQTITATVTYVDGTSDNVQSFTGVAVDSVTHLSGSLVVSFTTELTDTGTTVAVSDTGNRTWTKVSDTGSVAKFTATA